MARAWLEERLNILIPVLSALGTKQEAEIARLCEEEVAAWRARPEINKESGLRPIMSRARTRLKVELPVTSATEWLYAKEGKKYHIALKHLNFTPEEWNALNAISTEKFEARLRDQQVIDNPQ